jgi:single-strand DNA-binding protein
MARGVNKVILIGRVGREPETRYSASGAPVCNFSVAINEQWKDKTTGEKKESTTWVPVAAWNKLGEICSQYLASGAEVYVEGRYCVKEYTDKEGRKQRATDVIANEVQFLSGNRKSEAPKTATKKDPGNYGEHHDFDDEIPF